MLICVTIEELPDDVAQPVAWTERVVLMVIHATGTLLQCCPEKGVCGASCRRMHGRTHARKHVWVPVTLE